AQAKRTTRAARSGAAARSGRRTTRSSTAAISRTRWRKRTTATSCASEIMTPTKEALEATIEAAFGDVPPPPADQLVQPAYASSEDAYEMRTAFAGKRWTELPIRELFRHREMVVALSGAGYRAYV